MIQSNKTLMINGDTYTMLYVPLYPSSYQCTPPPSPSITPAYSIDFSKQDADNYEV